MSLGGQQALACASVGLGAWLMLQAGVAKNMLVLRTPRRCPGCGRRLERGGRCGC